MKKAFALTLAALFTIPACAELPGKPAAATPPQCLTTFNDFAMLVGFIKACPHEARAEIGTGDRLSRIAEGLKGNGECVHQIESEPVAAMLREHPATLLLGEDHKRARTQAETDAFCRRYHTDFTRIVRRYATDR